MYTLYVEANWITSDRQWTTMTSGSGGRPDLHLIKAIVDEGPANIFKLIVNSICPSIYGHELVKGTKLFTFANSFRSFHVTLNCVSIADVCYLSNEA